MQFFADVRSFYLALRLMDRQRTHIVRLRAIDADTDGDGLLVVGVIDSETAFEIILHGDIGGRLHLVLRKGYVLHALQCKDRLSVVVIVRLRHQIPTAFPCAQEIRNSGKMFLGLLVKRPIVKLNAFACIDGFQNRLHVHNACWRIGEHDPVAVLYCQLGHSFDMEGRKQILIERLIAFVVVVLDQVVFLRGCVVLDVTWEIEQNIILVPQERPRLYVAVVQRRIAVVLIDLFQTHRPSPLQEVNEIQAFLEFGHGGLDYIYKKCTGS